MLPPSMLVLCSLLTFLIFAEARKHRGFHEGGEANHEHHHQSHHFSWGFTSGALKFHQPTSSSATAAASARSNHVPIGPTKEQPATLQATVFLSENSTVVLAQTGSTPIMHCEVGDIGEGMVSWIRRKDYHLLTVGLATYSSDDRFFTAHVRHAQDWALHIKYAQEQDAGLYECQVSTHPPTSLFVELELVEAKAEILNAPDKYVKSGSALRLTCVLRKSTEPPVYLFWYHNDRMVNYDAMGVTVRHGRYSSELEVAIAKPEHSGNYSCVPSNTRPASIHVHILNGEKPAAMQHGSKSSAPSCAGSQVIFLTLLTFYCLMR